VNYYLIIFKFTIFICVDLLSVERSTPKIIFSFSEDDKIKYNKVMTIISKLRQG